MKLIYFGFLFSVFILHSVASLELDQVKKDPLKGYVLTNKEGQVVKNSGVRIGLLDLKFESNESLIEKYELPKNISMLVEPYLGLSGEMAVKMLKNKPLQLTQSDYNLVNEKLKAYWVLRLQKAPRFVRKSKQVIL